MKEKFIQLLRTDIHSWNTARKDIDQPDLTGANLRDVDLRGADLRGAVLVGADLSHANLQNVDLGEPNVTWEEPPGACLVGANLYAADLSGARLVLAQLDRADFTKANLSNASLYRATANWTVFRESILTGADLSGGDFWCSDLTGAVLSGCNLRSCSFVGGILNKTDLAHANFKRVVLDNTVISNTDLSRVDNIELCRHRGPSVLDHTTLEESGMLPEVFLRGCGLADWQIESTKLLQSGLSQKEINDIGYQVIRLRGEQPIQLSRAFISYSSKDDEFARCLYNDLQSEGVRCWFAPEDLKIGDRTRQRIDEAIHLHDKLLLVLSKDSVVSDWVEKEVETAFEKERENGGTVLFPIKVDDAVDKINTGWPADIRRSRNIGDFSNCNDEEAYRAALGRVLRDLRQTNED